MSCVLCEIGLEVHQDGHGAYHLVGEEICICENNNNTDETDLEISRKTNTVLNRRIGILEADRNRLMRDISRVQKELTRAQHLCGEAQARSHRLSLGLDDYQAKILKMDRMAAICLLIATMTVFINISWRMVDVIVRGYFW